MIYLQLKLFKRNNRATVTASATRVRLGIGGLKRFQTSCHYPDLRSELCRFALSAIGND